MTQLNDSNKNEKWENSYFTHRSETQRHERKSFVPFFYFHIIKKEESADLIHFVKKETLNDYRNSNVNEKEKMMRM